MNVSMVGNASAFPPNYGIGLSGEFVDELEFTGQPGRLMGWSGEEELIGMGVAPAAQQRQLFQSTRHNDSDGR